MSEKKMQRRYKAVFSYTLDEVAQRLEDETNKLLEEGYEVTVEPKSMPDGKGYGYMIHAELPQKPQLPTFIAMSPELAELLRKRVMGDEDHGKLGEKSKSLLNGLFSRLAGPPVSWENTEKEFRTHFPGVIQHYQPVDMRTMLDEFEAAMKHHDDEHEGDPKECVMHKTFSLVLDLLRENLKYAMQ